MEEGAQRRPLSAQPAPRGGSTGQGLGEGRGHPALPAGRGAAEALLFCGVPARPAGCPDPEPGHSGTPRPAVG